MSRIADATVPKGWSTTPLGEVVEILDSQRKPVNAKERASRLGDVPYYGATGQVGWIDDFLFDDELVLLGEDGAPFLDPSKAVAYMIRGKAWVNNHAHVLRALGLCPNAFLMHQLNQLSYRPFVSGTTRLKLPQGPMKQIPLKVPPLPEQHRIVAAIESYLTRLDDAVASLERVQKNLKRYRASVLKAAVEGRLVPTEAELARKEGRDYEPASVLLERILKERRRRWEEDELARLRRKQRGRQAKMKAKGKEPKDDKWKQKYKEPVAPDTSDLPDLPEGWCYVALPSLVLPTKAGMKTGPFGSLLQKSEHRPSGVPVIGIENIEPMRFVPGSKIHITAEKAGQLAGYDVVGGDLLISRSGTVGEVCVCPPDIGHARLSTNVMRIRFMDSAPIPEFVTMLLNGSPFVRAQISEMCKGTTRDFLNQRILRALVLPLPPIREQDRILAEVGRLLSISQATNVTTAHRQDTLQRLRQSILKWAFEGKLVDQDPTDEPASVLLERIKAERACLRRKQRGRQAALDVQKKANKKKPSRRRKK